MTESTQREALTLTTRDDMVVSVKGFSIAEGHAEGEVFRPDSPYRDLEDVSGDTILLLGHPASTFLRMMLKAGGVIAEEGTSEIEAASFMSGAKKPVLFGAGALPEPLTGGLRVRLCVAADNTASIHLA